MNLRSLVHFKEITYIKLFLYKIILSLDWFLKKSIEKAWQRVLTLELGVGLWHQGDQSKPSELDFLLLLNLESYHFGSKWLATQLDFLIIIFYLKELFLSVCLLYEFYFKNNSLRIIYRIALITMLERYLAFVCSKNIYFQSF